VSNEKTIQVASEVRNELLGDNISKPDQYCKAIEALFNLKDAVGRPFPYKMQPFQREWHSHFLLANPDSEFHLNRIWTKGRGLGATATTMIDLIMLAMTYRNLTIPISSITGQQAAQGPISWANWLCDNTQLGVKSIRDVNNNAMCRLPVTNSVIFVIPGNNPNALRTYRSPVVFYDEFDWCESQAELMGAGENVMSEELSQATVVSTIQNVRGEFQKIIDNAPELGYWVLRTPTFAPEEKLDVTRPLMEQIAEGLIKPIAPWINVKKLDGQRLRKPEIFLRENQCYAPDTGVNFLDWKIINNICSIRQWSPDNLGGWKGDVFKKFTLSSRPAGNHNHFTMGYDFARYHDLFVAEVFEHNEFGVVQRYEQVGRGSDTVSQNSLIDLLVEAFKPTEIRIDMTGPGTGLYDYAFDKHGSRVDGINFARSMEVPDADERARVKDLFALNFRRLAQDGKLRMFDSLVIKEDLNSVPYDLKDVKRTEEGSHGDRFWASCLAAWPAGNSAPFAFYR